MQGLRNAFPILEVADVAESLRFYRDLLGFEVVYAFPSQESPDFVALEIEGGKLGLGRAGKPVESASAAIWLDADDVDAEVERLRAAGVRVVAEPADQPWGERVASLADPDGYTFHIGTATG